MKIGHTDLSCTNFTFVKHTPKEATLGQTITICYSLGMAKAKAKDDNLLFEGKIRQFNQALSYLQSVT